MKISTILLVDDDLDDRDFFAGAISKVSPDVTLYCAIDGIAALEELATNNFKNVQLIVLDVNRIPIC
jgi:CheY-like chemotaxis protein